MIVRHRLGNRVLLSLCVFAAVSLISAKSHADLKKFVDKPEPAFEWQVKTQIGREQTGERIYDLQFVSQTWRGEKWRHQLQVYQPADAAPSAKMLLWVTGGSASPQTNALGLELARKIKAPVAFVYHVPNQPLLEGNLREDDLIAETFVRYLNSGDDSWPLLLPMVKSVVKAMDVLQAFSKKEWSAPVDRFIVAGASKRGWTTWTTAAVDKRVVAIMPLVIDMLNVEPSFQHHYRVYGFWAPAVGDYVENGIMNWTGTDRYHELMKIVEPYEYRDRLTMPKFMVNATGDQFFLPDSWQFYWKDLKGEKYIRYVPNTDHSLRRSDAADSIHAYYQSVIEGQERPKFDWKIDKDGTIHVRTETAPTAVKLWQATNAAARDFRLEKIGPAWKESALQPVKKGVYEAKVSAPPKGYTAYMVELTYSKGEGHPFKFTTGVTVVPNKEPFPSWQPKKPE